jgi:hypothetical protein
VIDQSQLEQAQLTQLTTALKQQMLKEIRETQPEKSMNSRLGNSSPGEIRTLVEGSRGPYAWPLHHRALVYHQNCVFFVITLPLRHVAFFFFRASLTQ